MKTHPEFATAVREELSDWRRWAARVVVLSFAAAAGLMIVVFTWLSEWALHFFFKFGTSQWWLPLLWTPAVTALIVWLTRRWAPGAAGSGIPQVMAVLEHDTALANRSLFISMKLSISKMLLTAAGLLGGLSLGREGPSVQIAAGVMRNARRWLPEQSRISERGLIMAGGAAGIAAAFNTPLGGIMFAIEELSKNRENRSNGLLLGAIVLSGLMAISAYGNNTYFGVIHVEGISMQMILPAVLVALTSGVAGGLFARVMVSSLSGRANDWFSRTRRRAPIRFATGCGLAIAVIGVVTAGATFGSGYEYTKGMLNGSANAEPVSVVLRYIATWLAAWSGVPGGIFAPSLATGAGIGNLLASLLAYPNAPTLMALGMAAFLAAVTQAPLTAFIIVMEMVDGHALVLSLMACAMVASAISRLISAPLYTALAQFQVERVR